MNWTYKTKALQVVHETAADLAEAGLLEKKTMRKFDELCLTPVPELTPDDIKAIREKEQLSQAVFARYLNVSLSLVSQWERGEKHPSGASLKLLVLVQQKGLQAIA